MGGGGEGGGCQVQSELKEHKKNKEHKDFRRRRKFEISGSYFSCSLTKIALLEAENGKIFRLRRAQVMSVLMFLIFFVRSQPCQTGLIHVHVSYLYQ